LVSGFFSSEIIFWDRIKQNKGQKKIIYIDEIWRLIGGTGNLQTAEFIYILYG